MPLMEAPHNRQGNVQGVVEGDLNRYHQNNSVQMAGKDNEVTYVQGSQNNTGSDTTSNSGGGQVTIIKQYFQFDYHFGSQANTVHGYPSLNAEMHRYPMALPPHRPVHVLTHDPRDARCHYAPAGCPHLGHPGIHHQQSIYRPTMYSSNICNLIHNHGMASARSNYIPTTPSLAYQPPLSSRLPIPISAPILSQVLMLVPTSTPASTQDGPFDEMEYPVYPPFDSYHPLPNQTQIRVPPWTVLHQAGLPTISHSSPTEIQDFESLSYTQFEPHFSSTSNHPSASQPDNFSTFYKSDVSPPLSSKFTPVEKRLQTTLKDQSTMFPVVLLQRGVEPEALPLESVPIPCSAKASQPEETNLEIHPDKNEEEEERNQPDVIIQV